MEFWDCVLIIQEIRKHKSDKAQKTKLPTDRYSEKIKQPQSLHQWSNET